MAQAILGAAAAIDASHSERQEVSGAFGLLRVLLFAAHRRLVSESLLQRRCLLPALGPRPRASPHTLCLRTSFQFICLLLFLVLQIANTLLLSGLLLPPFKGTTLLLLSVCCLSWLVSFVLIDVLGLVTAEGHRTRLVCFFLRLSSQMCIALSIIPFVNTVSYLEKKLQFMYETSDGYYSPGPYLLAEVSRRLLSPLQSLPFILMLSRSPEAFSDPLYLRSAVQRHTHSRTCA